MAFGRGKLNFCILPLPPPRNLALKFVSSFKEISNPQVTCCLLRVFKSFMSSGMHTSEVERGKMSLLSNQRWSITAQLREAVIFLHPGVHLQGGSWEWWGIEGSVAGTSAQVPRKVSPWWRHQKNSSDFSLMVPWHPARLFCRGWIFCWWSLSMSMESKQWRRLHNSHFFLWLTAWLPQQYDLLIMWASPEGRAHHALMFALSLSITQCHMESLSPLVGVTHWWNGLSSTLTSKPATPG